LNAPCRRRAAPRTTIAIIAPVVLDDGTRISTCQAANLFAERFATVKLAPARTRDPSG
jgi:hypothetical protein